MRFRKRFFVFITLLLIVPPLLTSLFLFSSISLREREVTSRFLDSQVRQVSGTVDALFSKLQADFVFLSYRDELLHLRSWAATSDYREKKEFLKRLDPYGTLSDYYDEALLVNAEDGWLVDIKNKNLSPVAGTNYQDTVERQLSVFRNRATGSAVLFAFQTVEGRSTYLVRRIDFPAVKRSLFLCVRISETFFRKVVDDTFLGPSSFVAIFDDRGSLVSLRTRGVELDEPRVAQLALDQPGPTGRFLISHYDSSSTLWRYVYGTDKNAFEAALIGELTRSSALVVAILALLGVGTYIFSRRLYTPLGQLFLLFRNDDTDKVDDDLESLANKASHLIASHRELRHSLESRQRLEKEEFLLELLDNPSAVEARLPKEVERLNLKMDLTAGTAWAVCLIQSGWQGGLAGEFLQASYQEDSAAFLAQYFQPGKGVAVEVFHRGRHRVGFLISLPAASGAPLAHLFRPVEGLTFAFAMALSRVHFDWRELKTAAAEAEIALDYRPLFQQKTVLAYEEVIKTQRSLYFYPFDLEHKLISAVKQMNSASTLDYFDLFVETLHLSGVSFTHMKHVFSHLADSLLHVAQDFEVPLEHRLDGEFANIWDRISSAEDPEDAEHLMRRFVQVILAGLTQEKKSNFDLLAQTVRKIIEDKYHDYSLSLDSISQDLRYSTSHLSAVFRSAYGETIKDFITQVRLEKACDMLLHSDYKVSRIAQEVGYLNLGSFVKIFKTYRGETPKNYQLRMGVRSRD